MPRFTSGVWIDDGWFCVGAVGYVATMAAAGGVLGPRKTVEECLETTEIEEFRLKKELGALDIVIFGIGVIIGAGIFVLTGVAAATEAGPAISLSLIFAAIVCAFAAQC